MIILALELERTTLIYSRCLSNSSKELGRFQQYEALKVLFYN
jgi:hypothetical protein